MQQEVFKDLDNGQSSDYFIKSSNEKGHNVHRLLLDITNLSSQEFVIFSEEMKDKILIVHKELLCLCVQKGKVYVSSLKRFEKSKLALQATASQSVHNYKTDTDNFYNENSARCC
ncbi:hypothetical protein O9993_18615 [Vibrio lentus]|nr:hypothetical protein [Vibrio lentus]